MGGGGEDGSDEEGKRRRKREAIPCGKVGAERMSESRTIPQNANESERKRRDVIDRDNVMPDGANPDVRNIFKNIIEAAQNVIQKIRTMFTQTSGNPNEQSEYLDGIEDAEMI